MNSSNQLSFVVDDPKRGSASVGALKFHARSDESFESIDYRKRWTK